jgi:hypothetical protein
VFIGLCWFHTGSNSSKSLLSLPCNVVFLSSHILILLLSYVLFVHISLFNEHVHTLHLRGAMILVQSGSIEAFCAAHSCNVVSTLTMYELFFLDIDHVSYVMVAVIRPCRR